MNATTPFVLMWVFLAVGWACGPIEAYRIGIASFVASVVCGGVYVWRAYR